MGSTPKSLSNQVSALKLACVFPDWTIFDIRKRRPILAPANWQTQPHTQWVNYTVIVCCFYLWNSKSGPQQGAHRDFLLPVVGGPPELQLQTDLETLISLTPYFQNTPHRYKSKHKALQSVCFWAPCQFLQWIYWEGFSHLGQTHEILLASENTSLPSSLWDYTRRGVMNLFLNQRG